MKHIIEGGTDGGSMLLFDPAALPDDYDQKSQDDPCSILEAATLNGDAYWINTDGDGGYLLHAFIDEPVSPVLTEFLRDEEEVPSFRVPSGRLYFAGVEYGFRHDDSFLQKHPHMGGVVEIAPASYSLSLFRTEFPEDKMEDDLRRRVSRTAFTLHQSMGWFVMLALIGLGCAVVSIFNSGLLPILLPVGITFIAVPFVVGRLPLYRDTTRIWTEVQRQYPSIVVSLKTNETEQVVADQQAARRESIAP
jgi:hypothetical protein